MESGPRRQEAAGWTENHVKRTADLWELTSEEVQGLEQLKEDLADIDHWKNSAEEVVRFLRARPGNIQAAADMFRAMVQWRIDNKVDTILEDYSPPELLLEHYPGAILEGYDKQGDPIYVGRMGVTDVGGMIKRYGRDELIQHGIWIREMVCRHEWLKVYEERQKRPMRRLVIIEDLHGLSAAHSSREALSLLGEIMRFDQDNYPETAKKLIIIRAPFLFRAIWAIIKHFFDSGVVEKMVFCGPSDYKKVLSEYMDLEVLPSAIVEEGQGKAFPGMPPAFDGGKLPPLVE